MSAAINRLWENRWAIVTAAVVTCAFILVGDLSPLLGIIGFAVVCAAVLAPRRQALTTNSTISSQPVHEAWPPLQSIMDALPDAVVAVDQASVVVAVNAAARKIAPALRQGEPIALSLRMPALIAA